jgi:tetratricopeptide (TPR) repeat protein
MSKRGKVMGRNNKNTKSRPKKPVAASESRKGINKEFVIAGIMIPVILFVAGVFVSIYQRNIQDRFGISPEPTATPPATSTSVPTLLPTQIVLPTHTPLPSKTPLPSTTPLPTATPLAFEPAQAGVSLIIIANFDDRINSAPDRIIYKTLEDQIVGVQRVVIKRYEQVIKDKSAATAVGKVYSATLVIWGFSAQYTQEAIVEYTGTGSYVWSDSCHLLAPDKEKERIVNVDLPSHVSYQVFLKLGKERLFGGDKESAYSLLTKAIEVPQVSEANPLNKTEAFFNRGNLLQDQGKFEDAIADYTRTVEIDPNYACAYIHRGNAFKSVKNTVSAIADYKQAIVLSPNDGLAYHNLGELYLVKGNYEEAISEFTKAIKRKPTTLVASYYERGRAYSEQNQLVKALEDFNNAVEIAPPNYYAYLNRGVFYLLKKKDYSKAAEDFAVLIKLKPNDADNYFFRSLAYRGFGDTQNYVNAIKDLSKAIEIRPDSNLYYSSRGEIYLFKGKLEVAINAIEGNHKRSPEDAFDNAIKDYSEAINRDKTDSSYFEKRCETYIYINAYEKAVDDCKEAIRLNPKNAHAFWHRGTAYKLLGNKQKAIEDLRQAITLGVSPSEKEAIDRLLDELTKKP